MAIFGQARDATRCVEIVLIPIAMLGLRSHRLYRMGDVLNVIAVARDQAAHPFRPQCRHNARRPTAPIVATEGRLFNAKGIHQVKQILGKGGLLARARCIGVDEARRAITPKIRDDHAVTVSGEGGGDFVVGARRIGKAMKQDDRVAGGGAVFFVGNVEL
ncbi:hypothetical protein D3C78_1316180 [compost metagenome]